jgi:hypothetical protein
MSKHALMISAALVGLLATAPAMAKGTYYQLPLVSGSTETISFGVNDSLVVTGFWLDSSGVQHGFVGPASGTNYTSFDDSSDPDTQARAINNAGYITGIDNDACGSVTCYIPFERTPDGTITNITMNGSTLNYIAQGINKKKVFTGSYENSSGTIIGYTGKNAQWKKDFTLPGITTIGVAGRGMDDAGDIVGWYEDSTGTQHGFLLTNKGKKAVTIDDPNGVTNLEGINNKGEASGLYTDSSGNRHGFTYNIKKKKFTELTISGLAPIEVWGLNDKGVVDIDGFNGSAYVGYLYCPKASDCPSGANRAQKAPVLHRGVRVPVPMP